MYSKEYFRCFSFPIIIDRERERGGGGERQRDRDIERVRERKGNVVTKFEIIVKVKQ